ncbi:MAG: BNR-4 repeat-containing protein [Spirochaetales bacterium]|nr:BNR-4 repeat-containing protein [Spirochaetales bacterium]
MKIKINFFILFFMTVFLLSPLYPAPDAVKEGEHLVTSNATTFFDDRYGDSYINCQAFIQDAIITYNGWQYVSYYNSNRYVTVSRRELPSGPWEHCVLSDYRETADDNHNAISMGISPSDGRIHLSFDHHNSTLHYRKSVSGLITNPRSFEWAARQFGSVENSLGSGTVTNFTYPCFVTAPDGTLLFYGRIGSSGDGDNYIWRYNTNGSWASLGMFIDGVDENAYHHGVMYDNNNRLHMTWCWRATSDGNTNHDLMYAYSDDHGATWKNNGGSVVGTTGSNPVSPSRDCRVWTIGQRTGLINSEGMIIDAQGRVHVLSREDVNGTNRQMHYYRDTGGTWHRIDTGIPTKVWDNRSKIAYDADGNVYGILPHVQIAGASVSSNYTDWRIIDNADDGRFFHSEPLIDYFALRASNELNVFVQAGTTGSTSSNMYTLTYRLSSSGSVQTPEPGNTGDVNSNGTIDIVDALLVAQYYVGLAPANFNQNRADANCNGTIDIVDALVIAQYYVGLIDRFC